MGGGGYGRLEGGIGGVITMQQSNPKHCQSVPLMLSLIFTVNYHVKSFKSVFNNFLPTCLGESIIKPDNKFKVKRRRHVEHCNIPL